MTKIDEKLADFKVFFEKVFRAVNEYLLLDLSYKWLRMNGFNERYDYPTICRQRDKMIQEIFELIEQNHQVITAILMWFVFDVLTKREDEIIRLIKLMDFENCEIEWTIRLGRKKNAY